MAYSSVTYTGDGSTVTFNIPFGYINQSEISVSVAGVVASFIWLSSTQIQLFTAPGVGAAVVVTRNTAIANPDITFADGYTLRAADLNTEFQQVLYGIQEVNDDLASLESSFVAAGNLPGVTSANNGEILQVVSGAWTLVTPSGFTSPLTTKGDLFVHSTVDTRLGVGSNGQVLTAASGAATGLQWANVPVADTSLNTGSSGVSVHLATNGGLNTVNGLLISSMPYLSSDPGSPTNGAIWYNTTNLYLACAEAGQVLHLVKMLGETSTDSGAISNVTTMTACNQSFSLPAGTVKVGASYRVTISAQVTSVTGTPNVSLGLFLNSTVLDAATFAAGAGSRLFATWIITCRSTGTSGTLIEYGEVHCESNSQVLGQNATFTINTNAANTLTPGIGWSAASASNSAVIRQFIVEKIN